MADSAKYIELIEEVLAAKGWSILRPMDGQQIDSTDVAQVIVDAVRPEKLIQAIKDIQSVIENIPSDIWEEAQCREDFLWQRLDDIDAICLEALLVNNCQHIYGFDGTIIK